MERDSLRASDNGGANQICILKVKETSSTELPLHTYKMWFHKSSNSDRHFESERPKGLELKISPERSQVPLGKNLGSREKKEAKNKWEVIKWPKNRKRRMMKFGKSISWEMDFYSPKFFHLWPLCFPRPF